MCLEQNPNPLSFELGDGAVLAYSPIGLELAQVNNNSSAPGNTIHFSLRPSLAFTGTLLFRLRSPFNYCSRHQHGWAEAVPPRDGQEDCEGALELQLEQER
jgi:hypothetical protein